MAEKVQQISGVGLMDVGVAISGVGTAGVPSDDFGGLSLSLGAIVLPIDKRPEGSLIQVVLPAWKEIMSLLLADPSALRELNPRQGRRVCFH